MLKFALLVIFVIFANTESFDMEHVSCCLHHLSSINHCMPFSSMQDALKQKMGATSPLRTQIESAQIIQKAEEALLELFGEEMKQVKVLFVKNGTLTITCHSSVVAQEIRLNQAKIIMKINSFFARPVLERIRYLS